MRWALLSLWPSCCSLQLVVLIVVQVGWGENLDLKNQDPKIRGLQESKSVSIKVSLCYQPSGNWCRPEEYWTLPVHFWPLGRHVSHGVYKEQAAHFPLASLGSSTTVEYHCPENARFKEENQSGNRNTHAETRWHVFAQRESREGAENA